jgi:hypothetical protein
LGHQTFIEAQTKSGAEFTGLIDGETIVKLKQQMPLSFKSIDCHLFGTDGEALPRMKTPKVAG